MCVFKRCCGSGSGAFIPVVIGVAVACGSAIHATAKDPDPAKAPASGERGQRGERGDRGGRRGPEGEAVNVERAMKTMQHELDELKGSIGDASKKDDNLHRIALMERAASGAKAAGVPGDVLSKLKTDAEKTKVADGYRANLARTLRAILELETQTAAGKTKEARETLTKIESIREEGHGALDPNPPSPLDAFKMDDGGGKKASGDGKDAGKRDEKSEGDGARDRAENIDVERVMKGMQRTLRNLRPTIADASKREDNLKMINQIERGALTSKLAGVPGGMLAKAKTDAEKNEIIEKYRGGLISVVGALLDLEEQVVQGKGPDASATLDKVIKIRDESHKALGAD